MRVFVSIWFGLSNLVAVGLICEKLPPGSVLLSTCIGGIGGLVTFQCLRWMWREISYAYPPSSWR